jgi:hypothetical protein
MIVISQFLKETSKQQRKYLDNLELLKNKYNIEKIYLFSDKRVNTGSGIFVFPRKTSLKWNDISWFIKNNNLKNQELLVVKPDNLKDFSGRGGLLEVENNFFYCRDFSNIPKTKKLVFSKETTSEEKIKSSTKKHIKNNKNKVVVYTCITNGYDNLWEPEITDDTIDFICFTDDLKIKSNTQWSIRKIPKIFNHLPKTKIYRALKLLPHILFNNYDMSLWVDGSVQIKKDLEGFINSHSNKKITLSENPYVNCIYEESDLIKKLKKEKPEVIDNQISKYSNLNYPKNNGSVQTGVLFRKHNDPEVIKFNEDWWRETLDNSNRDQLSFNFLKWKSSLNINIIPPDTLHGEFFKLKKHRKHWTNM